MLLDAIFLFHGDGEIPALSAAAAIAFEFMKNQFNVDAEKYAKKCQKNKENINRRWAQKDTKDTDEYERIPNDTTAYEPIPNDNDIIQKKKDNIQNGNSEEKLKEKTEKENLFAVFWRQYPARNGRKLGKGNAQKRFCRFKIPVMKQIITAAGKYAKSGQMAKDPERFLKDDYWKEWIPEPENTRPDKNGWEVVKG